jgi:hypothetical protein
MKEAKRICTDNVEEFVALKKYREEAKKAEAEYQQLKIDHSKGLVTDEDVKAGYKKMRQAQKANDEAKVSWYGQDS